MKEGERLFGRPGPRWTTLKGWEGVNWIRLVQNRGKWPAVVNTGSIKCGEFLY
jgi:hypothetical protein